MQTLFQTIVCGLQEWFLSVNLIVMPYHSALVWHQETRMLCSQISICQKGLYVIISYADCVHDHSARIRYHKLYKESQCVLSKKNWDHTIVAKLCCLFPPNRACSYTYTGWLHDTMVIWIALIDSVVCVIVSVLLSS